ncbi:unnamed protein product [Didymodactylos carnosus]|uniref:glutathione transferase n=1 Tax=Didymodactylos carnosus TaxID=1234261 RepID=A0A8S2CZQ4_9BILA|nr:unnamed protein product [Didymodactylos carnosus]CAF3561950.1 unnamed protein product [Didymodactylos carnosus]
MWSASLKYPLDQRILWLLEELEIPYEIKIYERGPDMRAPKELEAVHPLGKSPVITDGPITIAESGAIIEYIISKYGNGRLKPASGTEDQLQYTYWLHFAEGSAMSPLLLTLIFDNIKKNSPFFIRPIANGIALSVDNKFIQQELTKIFGYIESELTKREYFAGNEFSAADIQMSFPIEAASSRAAQYLGPNTKKLLDKLQGRPAYLRALEKGGPYKYGPNT